MNNTVDAAAEKKQDDENHNEDSDDELFPLPPHTGMITMNLMDRQRDDETPSGFFYLSPGSVWRIEIALE